MINNSINKKPQAGYTLITTAMFLIVAGLFVVSILAIQNQNQQRQKYDGTKERISQTQEALQNFRNQHGRYPCPAPINLSADQVSANNDRYGSEPIAGCNTAGVGWSSFANDGFIETIGVDGMRVVTGAIPVRALNLPDEYQLDMHGHKIFYAVTTAFTDNSTGPIDFNTNFGDIGVQDSTNQQTGASANNLFYALIATNEDARGAFNMEGQEISQCPVNTIAGENCDGDALFAQNLEKNTNTASDQQFTHQVAFAGNPTQFFWATSAWSNCNAQCGQGTRARDVKCQNSQGVDSPSESYCDSVIKPASEEACSGTNAYNWDHEPGFSQWNAYCGAATREKAAMCECNDVPEADITKCEAEVGPAPAPITETRNIPCEWEEGACAAGASCNNVDPVTCEGSCSGVNKCVREGMTIDPQYCTDPEPLNLQTCTVNKDSCCVASEWTPDIDPATICTGETIEQTSNCGDVRIVKGTKNCLKPACGPAHGDTFLNVPDNTILCGQGAYSDITTTNSSYLWSCYEAGITTNRVECSARVREKAECGSASGFATETVPITGTLCSHGDATEVSVVNGEYVWSCTDPQDTANIAECSAPRIVPPPACPSEYSAQTDQDGPVCVKIYNEDAAITCELMEQGTLGSKCTISAGQENYSVEVDRYRITETLALNSNNIWILKRLDRSRTGGYTLSGLKQFAPGATPQIAGDYSEAKALCSSAQTYCVMRQLVATTGKCNNILQPKSCSSK